MVVGIGTYLVEFEKRICERLGKARNRLLAYNQVEPFFSIGERAVICAR